VCGGAKGSSVSNTARHRLSIGVVIALCFALGMSAAVAGEVPEAEMTFSIEGQTFLGGQNVAMSGRIQPATEREVIRLETQVFRNDAWRAYDIKRTRTTLRGRFSYTHEAFPAGKRYRTRALWAETVDHLAGRTVWDSFRVTKRAR